MDARGRISTFVGSGVGGTGGDGGLAARAQLRAPTGLPFDSHGNLYIADTGANRIRRIDTHGIITTVGGARSPADGGFAGDGGPAANALLSRPIQIAFDTTGNLYFTDQGNHRVRRIDTHGTITTVLAPTT